MTYCVHVYIYTDNSIIFLNQTSTTDISPFPTRRSSDLGSVTWVVRRTSVGQLFGGEQNHALPARGALGARARQLIDSGKVDRKSTRLNSSHVEISYAVFCLKKKSTTNCTSHPKL